MSLHFVLSNQVSNKYYGFQSAQHLELHPPFVEVIGSLLLVLSREERFLRVNVFETNCLLLRQCHRKMVVYYRPTILTSVTSLAFIYGLIMDKEEFTKDFVKGEKFSFSVRQCLHKKLWFVMPFDMEASPISIT